MDVGKSDIEEDSTFDEYDTAPAEQANSVSTGTYTFIGDGILQSDNSWSLWIDRELRIVPGFHKAFSREPPIHHHTTQSTSTTASHSESSSS